MVWSAISYHRRSNLLRIEDIIQWQQVSSEKCYRPKSFPSFKASLQLSFSRIMHAHILQRLFCSAQHMQLLPWPAHSPDMLPIEHVWDFVGRRLARDPRPAVSKDKLFATHISNMEFSSTSRHSKSV
ncbi:UNVERIFIED_CONTAM: hypothetical protein NCL1_33460 [Trichonephila clavipes]